jgi:hypothetical protein
MLVLPFFFPATLILGIAGPEGAKNLAGDVLRLIQIRLPGFYMKTPSICQAANLRVRRGESLSVAAAPASKS